MSNIGRALSDAGITSKVIHPGDVWLCPNQELFLSDDKLKGRTPDEKDRPVIVVANDAHCADPAYISVYVVPTSRQVHLKDDTSLLLAKATGGLAEDSIGMVDIMQPVLKKDLTCKIGKLPEDNFHQLLALIAEVVGIT